MTDLRKAAEMALEALQYTCDYLPAKTGVERDVDDAITALRQALAQPEQEPLVWMNKHGHVASFQNEEYKDPLYTAPPKREWVGLSDEEIDTAVKSCNTLDTYKYFRAIEAKLKDKNSG